MLARASYSNIRTRPAAIGPEDWSWALIIAAGLAGGALSVIVGELVSSGAVRELLANTQTVGAQMGGALNNVSQGEQDVLRRSLVTAIWAHSAA